MAFPAYQIMNIPEIELNSVDEVLNSCSIDNENDELLPNINLPFNDNLRSELETNNGLEVSSQRVDDIPLILATLQKMDIPNQIDQVLIPHGNRGGLSFGWLTTVWLIYIISQQDHRMNRVQEWVNARRSLLELLIERPISESDLTDDRLADLLRHLSQLASWNSLEKGLNEHLIRVYNLDVERIRLDATSATVRHDPDKSNLFEVGRTKEGDYDTQFKMMLATLDPLGLPIAVDVVSGNSADDPLYLPIYQRIRQTLTQSGLLYIGDCKMAALQTRAEIANNDDYYLTPLPQTGDNPPLLAKQIERVMNNEVELIEIYRDEDLPQESEEKPDPKKRLGQGFEFSRSQTSIIHEIEVNWNERVLMVRSESYAQAQIKLFERRLVRASEELVALTPPPRRGCRQHRELEPLQIKVNQILNRLDVADYFDIVFERQEKSRLLRAYRGRPARLEVSVRYQLHLTRKTEAIETAKQSLGWRLYVTNEKVKRLSITQAVLAYREQYREEQQFSRLKGPLGITPLYVQRDDHA